MGKQRSTVSNYIRLLGLPAGVQQSVAAGHLSFGHARVLAGLQEAEEPKGPLPAHFGQGLERSAD